MKLNFLKHRTKSYLKKNKAIRSNLPYNTAQTAGVIFTVEDNEKHLAIKEFVKRLEQDGKHVQVLEYLPEQRQDLELKFDFFTDKDISFWGDIHSGNFIQFADAPFDFLFLMDLQPNILIQHLLARSRAKCRVGKYWEGGDEYLDFMFESVNDLNTLMDSSYKYVTQLR